MLCPIAEGGMAEAWVARLQGKFGFEKLVAVKTILPKFAADVRFQQMFLDEARIASRIEHTNVAQIFDLGDEHGVLYLVMEWVHGDALTKLHRAVEKKGLTIPHGVLLRVLADTCGGLHAAHELRGEDGTLLGVVHRDVSPQNILVSARGVAKLIDFGIAKARDRLAGDTNTGLLKGKVQYMAPEQALGREVDRRADIWAVGALLYHLLAGKPAYEGVNQLATLHMLTAGKPPSPLPDSVPAPIVASISRALSQNPDDRYSTAAEMQTALERAMVDADVCTTTEDVAAFVDLHLAERAAKRKESIDLALRAAQERVRMHTLLKIPRHDSVSDLPSSPRLSVPPNRASGPWPAVRSLEADDESKPTVSELKVPPSAPEDTDAEIREPKPPPEPNRAVYLTGESTVKMRIVTPGIDASRRMLRAALAVLLALGVIGVAVFAFRIGRESSLASRSAAPTRTVAPSAPVIVGVPPLETSVLPMAKASPTTSTRAAESPSGPGQAASGGWASGAPWASQRGPAPTGPATSAKAPSPAPSKIPEVLPNGF